VNTLNWRFDFLLAGKVLGTDGLGIYSVGNNLARLPTRETTMPLTQTIYPGLAAVGQDIQKLAAAYQRVQSLVTAVALPAGVGVAVIADPLVRLVLGEKWLAVIPVIQGLASIFALQTLGSQVRAVALTKGVPRLLLIQDVQVLIVRLPIVTIGLLMYGLPGLVWARVITGLIELFINLLLIRKLIELPIIAQLSANGRTFLSVAAMAIGVMLISWYVPNADGRADLLVQILLQIGFGILLYGGAIVLLWCVAKRPPGLERDAIMLAHNLIGSRLGANTE
jgi:O-antigen/teichoic acid export membrane protein